MFEWIEMDLYHAIAAHKFKTKNELFHLNSFAGNMFGIGELSMDFDILRRIRSRTLRADTFVGFCWKFVDCCQWS